MRPLAEVLAAAFADPESLYDWKLVIYDQWSKGEHLSFIALSLTLIHLSTQFFPFFGSSFTLSLNSSWSNNLQ